MSISYETQAAQEGIATFFRAPYRTLHEVQQDDVVVAGAPFDGSITLGRRGARLGPRAIREAACYWASMMCSVPNRTTVDLNTGRAIRVPTQLPLVDVGDADCFPMDAEATIRSVADVTHEVVERGAFPVLLGGDHLMALPGFTGVAEALATKHNEVRVAYLHVDAHTDLWDEQAFAGRFCHSTSARRVSEHPNVDLRRMAWLGLDGSFVTQDVYDYAKGNNFLMLMSSELSREGWEARVDDVLGYLSEADFVYVSFDIDVVDGSHSPGTTATVFGGVTPDRFLGIAERVGRIPNLAGVDCCEVAPNLDPLGRTARLAALGLLTTLGPRLFEMSEAPLFATWNEGWLVMLAGVRTVLGEVPPSAIGPTSMHEHLLLDLRRWRRPGEDVQEGSWQESDDPLAFEENLLLSSAELAAEELADFRSVGGSCVVDMTSEGLGGTPASLPGISAKSQVHVVLGCGFFVHDFHPAWVCEATTETLEEYLLEEIRDGVAGSRVRPGVLGEIGVSEPAMPCEVRVLRAAARAGRVTGLSVHIHVDAHGVEAPRLVDICIDEALAPDRIVCGHMDVRMDLNYHLQVLKRGATIGLDTFGTDVYFPGALHRPDDAGRVSHLARLLEMGFASQIVLAQDVAFKSHLRANGGVGYGHLLRSVLPAAEASHGLSEADVHQLMVLNPRRLLSAETSRA